MAGIAAAGPGPRIGRRLILKGALASLATALAEGLSVFTMAARLNLIEARPYPCGIVVQRYSSLEIQ